MEPLEFFSYFADKYSYSAKSSHGRVNGELKSGFYEKRLDVYNIYDAKDQRLCFEFLSGRKMFIDFTIVTDISIKDQGEAVLLYEEEIKTTPFEKQILPDGKRIIKLFE